MKEILFIAITTAFILVGCSSNETKISVEAIQTAISETKTAASNESNFPSKETKQPITEATNTDTYSETTQEVIEPFVDLEETPISKGEIIPTEGSFTEIKMSDKSGQVFIEDSENQKIASIQVLDRDNDQPIANIEVVWISNGEEFVVLAVDPGGNYLPAAVEGKFENSITENFSAKPISFGNRQNYQTWEDVALILELVEAIGKIESLKDLVELFDDWADITDHFQFKGWYFEYCLTGNQIANYFSGAMLFIPGGKITTEPAKLISAAIVAISKHIIEEEAQQFLYSLEGRHKIHLTPSPIPWTIFFSYKGQCEVIEETPDESVDVEGTLEPAIRIDRTDVESVVGWLVYGLETGEIRVFEDLITGENIGYGTGLANGRRSIPKERFIEMLRARLPNSALCEGYYVQGNTLMIWTSNWVPEWEFHQIEVDFSNYSDVITLGFHKSGDGYSLGTAYFTPAPGILEGIEHYECPQP